MTPRKNFTRRRLLKSAVAALGLSAAAPLMAHCEPLTPVHQLHSYTDSLLEQIGQMPPGADWLRSWLGHLILEPTTRVKGLVLVGPDSFNLTFTLAHGLVSDGYLACNENLVLEQFDSGARLVTWGSQRPCNELVLEHCLTATHLSSSGSSKPDERNGKLNQFHWIEGHERDPARRRDTFQTFDLGNKSSIKFADLYRRLADEKEDFVRSLQERRPKRYPSLYLNTA